MAKLHAIVRLNISENYYYLIQIKHRWYSDWLKIDFHMLTNIFSAQGILEACRSLTEKVTAFADFETVFAGLSKAANGANCYNFLR